MILSSEIWLVNHKNFLLHSSLVCEEHVLHTQQIDLDTELIDFLIPYF